MKGAFQISREIFENDIWADVPKFRVFFYILGNAVFSHDGVKKGGILIKRGQFLRSYRNLVKDLEYKENRSIKRYSTSVIKRKIDQLVKEDRLKIKDTELGTLFTVVNYDLYQDLNNYKKGNLERSENSVGTQRERSENNNKNVKECTKNEKEERPKQVYDETSLYFKMSTYFYELILKNNPDHQRPNLQKWSDEFRKLVELDKKSKDQVREVMEFVQSDEFEMVNVLSPTKLRKRYEQLLMKVKQSNNNVVDFKKKGYSPSQKIVSKEDMPFG